MSSFGEFVKVEREKKGWSQTDFGALVKINMTAISRIENDRKNFNATKLKLLAKLFEIDFEKINDLYYADKFAKEAYQNNCSDEVFSVAENQSKYLKNKNIKQSEMNF